MRWGSAPARRVLRALYRIGWVEKRVRGSHRVLAREGWPDFVFAFHLDTRNVPLITPPAQQVTEIEYAGGFVDAALEFIDQAQRDQKPSFINVWPDDVHSPYWPPVEKWGKDKRSMYLAVLVEKTGDTEAREAFALLSRRVAERGSGTTPRGVEVRTPARFHLGMFSFGDPRVRSFGGTGVMLEEPGIDAAIDDDALGDVGEADRGVRRGRRVDGDGGDRLGPAREEVERSIREAGDQAVLELGLSRIHGDLIRLLGSLKYRYSYAQNVLRHSVEVAFLSGMLAEMVGLNGDVARRCGLLHDIGKAADHELEGGHPKIGADLLKRHGEKAEIVQLDELSVPYK